MFIRHSALPGKPSYGCGYTSKPVSNNKVVSVQAWFPYSLACLYIATHNIVLLAGGGMWEANWPKFTEDSNWMAYIFMSLLVFAVSQRWLSHPDSTSLSGLCTSSLLCNGLRRLRFPVLVSKPWKQKILIGGSIYFLVCRRDFALASPTGFCKINA